LAHSIDFKAQEQQLEVEKKFIEQKGNYAVEIADRKFKNDVVPREKILQSVWVTMCSQHKNN